tara:strand:- start:12330 stop:13694 length:1365 start_codon:yes stop_codon:yes gene_type:complete
MSYKFKISPQKVEKINTKYRKIDGKIPCEGTEKILKSLSFTESRSMHGQIPLVWDSAEDFTIKDSANNQWIDFTSAIFFANVGHSNKRVTKALKETLGKPIMGCYAYSNEVRAKYFKRLLEFSGGKFEKAFLLSAGTEATEAALKLMRMNGQKVKKRKLGIVSLENNWHGRTMGAQLMGGNESQKEWIGFKDKDIFHLSFPYPWVLKGESGESFANKSIDLLLSSGIDAKKDLCGFMIETFQGWGAIFYPSGYIEVIRDFCNKNEILLTFDEMQSGFARTGKAFGYENYNVNADLICVGKGMGGGFPLSGVLGSSFVMDLPETGNMSSTHSANPLACAAGLAVIEEIEEKNLINESLRKGELLINELNLIKDEFSEHVSYVMGKGLIAAIHFHEDGEPNGNLASIVCEKCLQKGLLVVHTGRESIKIGPPLTISDEALVEGVNVIKESLIQAIQ